MMKTYLSVLVASLAVVGLSGCSSPAGKVAKHKAKKVSPIHKTAGEKVADKVEKAGDRISPN